jgi:uncharacterized protein (DUF952 family)
VEEAAASGPVAADQHARHGFVHCCTREQIVEIAAWWLADDAPLTALEIDLDAQVDVRFERPEGEAREFPHVYAAIDRGAIVAAHDLPSAAEGFALPPAIASPPPAFEVAGHRASRPCAARWQNGALIDGDRDVVAAAHELVEKGAPVERYLHVVGTASLATAYEAFAVLDTVFDEITVYRGDCFLT